MAVHQRGWYNGPDSLVLYKCGWYNCADDSAHASFYQCHSYRVTFVDLRWGIGVRYETYYKCGW